MTRWPVYQPALAAHPVGVMCSWRGDLCISLPCMPAALSTDWTLKSTMSERREWVPLVWRCFSCRLQQILQFVLSLSMLSIYERAAVSQICIAKSSLMPYGNVGSAAALWPVVDLTRPALVFDRYYVHTLLACLLLVLNGDSQTSALR